MKRWVGAPCSSLLPKETLQTTSSPLLGGKSLRNTEIVSKCANAINLYLPPSIKLLRLARLKLSILQGKNFVLSVPLLWIINGLSAAGGRVQRAEAVPIEEEVILIEDSI